MNSNGNDERCGQRADVVGGSYLFIVNLTDRKRSLLLDHVDVLCKVMKSVKSPHPFHIDAMVIPPDHLHALCTLPAGDRDFPMCWMPTRSSITTSPA